MIALQGSIFMIYLMTIQVLAFTNGTLVPAYLCNAAADGMPKTFGLVNNSTIRTLLTSC
jgi:hypothetical protein